MLSISTIILQKENIDGNFCCKIKLKLLYFPINLDVKTFYLFMWGFFVCFFAFCLKNKIPTFGLDWYFLKYEFSCSKEWI